MAVATTLPGSTPNMSATSLTGSVEPLLKIRIVRTAPDHPFPLTRHNSLIYHSFGVSDSVPKEPATLPGAGSCARMRVSNGDVMTTIRAPDPKRPDLSQLCR